MVEKGKRRRRRYEGKTNKMYKLFDNLEQIKELLKKGGKEYKEGIA